MAVTEGQNASALAQAVVPVESNSHLDKIKEDTTTSQTKILEKQSLFSFIIFSFRELTCTKFALTSFVINNLRRRYRRSVLGFAWSLLNPLLTMAVLTVVFSILFHANPRSFAIFVFTGLLPWTFITDAITTGSQAIVSSESYLKKVYIPKTFFPLVAVSTEAINFILSLASLMLIAVVLGMQAHLTLLLVPAAICILFLFNYALALFLAVATVYFRDLTHIIKVVLGTLFYLVPIIYPLSRVPEKYHLIFFLNPFYYFIDLFHLLIYEGSFPTIAQWLTPIGITVVSLLLAFSLLKNKERDLIFRL